VFLNRNLGSVPPLGDTKQWRSCSSRNDDSASYRVSSVAVFACKSEVVLIYTAL